MFPSFFFFFLFFFKCLSKLFVRKNKKELDSCDIKLKIKKIIF